MHTLTTAKFGSVRKPWTTFRILELYCRLAPDKVYPAFERLGPE